LDFFLKHQKIIFRTLGGAMLLIGFVVHFWLTPKDGISKNDFAAANVARMEASVSRSSSTEAQEKKSSATHIMSALEEQQQKQMEYLTILVMIIGISSLGYSFIKKDETVA
jgi:hypothetical protein